RKGRGGRQPGFGCRYLPGHRGRGGRRSTLRAFSWGGAATPRDAPRMSPDRTRIHQTRPVTRPTMPRMVEAPRDRTVSRRPGQGGTRCRDGLARAVRGVETTPPGRTGRDDLARAVHGVETTPPGRTGRDDLAPARTVRCAESVADREFTATVLPGRLP